MPTGACAVLRRHVSVCKLSTGSSIKMKSENYMQGRGYDDTVAGWQNLAKEVGHCRAS